MLTLLPARWPNFSLLPTHLLDTATHNVLTNKQIANPGLEYGPDAGDMRKLGSLHRPHHHANRTCAAQAYVKTSRPG